MIEIAMDFTPSGKRYFNSKNSQYLMEKIMLLKTVFNKFISLRTIQRRDNRFVVSFKPAPKVCSLREMVPNGHEVY